MKIHKEVKYLLRNGEKRTMYLAGDRFHLHIVKPDTPCFLYFNADGTTVDRTKSEYDVVSLADTHIVPDRVLPKKPFPKKDQLSDSNPK